MSRPGESSPLEQVTRYLFMVYRQRWILLISTVLFGAIGLTLALVLPKRYQSKGKFMVDASSATFGGAAFSGGKDMEERAIQSIPDILKSQEFLRRVIDISVLRDRVDRPDEREDMIKRLMEHIGFTRSGVNIVTISYEGSTPAEAADVATVVIANYKELMQRIHGRRIEELIRKLDEQSNIYLEELSKIARRLIDFETEHIEVLPGTEQNLRTQLTRARLDLRAIEFQQESYRRQLDLIDRQIRDIPEFVDDESILRANPAIREQEALVSQLRQLLAAAEIRYTTTSTSFRRQKRELEVAEERLEHLKRQTGETKEEQTQVRNPILRDWETQRTALLLKIQEADSMAASLRNEIETLSEQVRVIPEIEARLKELHMDYDLKRDGYLTLLNLLENQQLAEGLKEVGIRFTDLDTPVAPIRPSFPNIPIFVLGGLGIGFAFGALVGFLREFLNQTIRSVDEVRSILALPVLATVPRIEYFGEEAAPIGYEDRKGGK